MSTNISPSTSNIAREQKGRKHTECYFDLEGKVAAVTGTTRGIGRALAVGLARAGAKIVHLNRSSSESVQDELAALGGSSFHVPLQLDDEESSFTKAAEKAIAWRGRVDILVNSAGLVKRAPALEQSADMIMEVTKIDLLAPVLLAKAFAPYMIAQGSGKIINIASLMSFQGGVDVLGYAAAKSGLAGATKAMANEWAIHGVNVNAIAPGYIATEINEDLRNDESRRLEFLQRIPAGRWGTAEDLVGAAIFLSSGASNYVNGHVLAVDGGWLSR
ncbi:SDR family oxidoreductase [Arthrobacter sp. 2MCAF14]|uniref:SDR family oxidoreductase n=1 Tax=Arthrobacter sp. 2MCAF14 TaxID=3232982 RepID=UPI003F90364F